jgi:hypothetical protein
MFIRKYDTDGNFLWERRYFDFREASIQGIAVDESDNIYVTGNLFTDTYPHAHQWATLKYDKDGNFILGPITHNQAIDFFLPDISYDVAVDQDGNIIVVGIIGISGCFGCADNNSDWHVRKYDPNGSLIWEDTYNGPANLYDHANSVAVDGNGDVYVAGWTNIGLDNTDSKDYDWLIMKYSADGVGGVGERHWTRTYESGPERSEACFDLVVDNEGIVLVAGYEQDVSGIRRWRLEKLDPANGSLLDEQSWNADQNHEAYSISFRIERIAVGGSSDNGADPDMITMLLDSLGEPKPDIKANGSDGLLTVTPDDTVDITVSLKSGVKLGVTCEWWIAALTPCGNYWLTPSRTWEKSETPISFGRYPLEDMKDRSLQRKRWRAGLYLFFFALDDRPDGTFWNTWYDFVNVASHLAGSALDSISVFKAPF